MTIRFDMGPQASGRVNDTAAPARRSGAAGSAVSRGRNCRHAHRDPRAPWAGARILRWFCADALSGPEDRPHHVRRERLRTVRDLQVRQPVSARVRELPAQVADPVRGGHGRDLQRATARRSPDRSSFMNPLPESPGMPGRDRVDRRLQPLPSLWTTMPCFGLSFVTPCAATSCRTSRRCRRSPRRRRRRSGPPKPGTDGFTWPTSAGSILTSARSLYAQVSGLVSPWPAS